MKKICEDGYKADVASVGFCNAVGEKADLYVTIKELASQFPPQCEAGSAVMHKAKFAEDIKDALLKLRQPDSSFFLQEFKIMGLYSLIPD